MKDEQINFFYVDKDADYNDKKVLEELDSLRKKIEYHSKRYYEDDEPEITDFEYDMLTQRLKKIEKEHPEYIDNNSPTQKVGGRTKKIFTQVNHDVQMQSLQDVFSFEDVEEFVKKVKLEYGNDTKLVVETKIDGLSVSLEYSNGKLIRGSTRGDGFVGEDITQNVKMIKSVPQEISYKGNIEIRGEAYLGIKEFSKINEDFIKLGKPILANPRNAAAGALRQLDSKIVEKRNLSIFIFNIQKSDKKFLTHIEGLDFLDSLGFTTISLRTLCNNEREVISAIKNIGNLRNELEYQIDGAVVKVNDLKIRDEMGSTVKVPKWAVAYKYPPEQKQTKIIDIITQVGRTGQVTPMAILDPIRVAGSLISRTTLHNFDYIDQKDIRVGDIAVIEKAGDVIPEVVDIIKEKRNGSEIKVLRPILCPVCGEKLEQEEGIVALRCTNSECTALVYRSVVHFASRDAMDISGLGETIVEKLIEIGLIKDIADIYYLKYEDIVKLDRFAPKSAQNLIDAINETKSNSLDKLIFGLGIRHIGKKAAKVLAKHFNSIYEIMNSSIEDLNSLDDFGLIMSESVVEFFKKDKTKQLIKKFKNIGVNLNSFKNENESTKLKDINFVVTGSFEKYTRSKVVELIEKNSGKVVGSVSKKTNYVIVGKDAGSKLKKAEELKINILSIDDFINMIK
ncbi:MAG: NAD-dependent DNA ligase LigA [Clostridia bacterium]